MEDPTPIEHADLVLMESTYGDRLHRSFDDTLVELGEVFADAERHKGNVPIPAFAVGRTQDLLYLLDEHFDEWMLRGWRVFLDSPMAIQANEVYADFRHLYGAEVFRERSDRPQLSNFAATRTSEESMALNRIESGAIIIAGSGMCTGGRILHHLKHNLWRPQCTWSSSATSRTARWAVASSTASSTCASGSTRSRSTRPCTRSAVYRRTPTSRDRSTGIALSRTVRRFASCTVSRKRRAG
jgi:hypothetical protein